ncbi:MAG: LytR/AlgR family response regulator transcription factor [Capnocytophaga sp.]|jgi:two component transcriptional regulator, lytTR family|uniref:LytR/AlgR family response regulator transcription factor n=1 Tax=Capnocytophaga sp. TaxID=44737 RepID=UPI003FA06305
MTCLIVDDEPMALQLIESYVLKTPSLQLVGKFSNAIEVLQYFLGGGTADLIYLDIQMPELSGLDLSKKLPPETRIVFTTAFDKYAIEGYKANTIGYLLKPFDYTEFLETVQKAQQLISISSPTALPPDFFFVKSESRQVKVLFDDIRYIESVKDYAKIHLLSQEQPLVSLVSLKKLEEQLPPEQFMRVHRSFIVALNKVKIVERNHIVFGKERIGIAESCREAFLTKMKISN